jgi:hypothetical protein
MRDSEFQDFALALYVELREARRPLGFNVRSWRNVGQQLSRTPPEIEAYRPGLWRYMHRRFGSRISILDAGIDRTRYYFKERFDPVGECYLRFLTMVSPPKCHTLSGR